MGKPRHQLHNQWGVDPSKNVLSLRQVGAAGDGTTDDSGRLRSAIERLAAQGGGTLFVPRGTFRIPTDAPIRVDAPIEIRGNGPQSVLDFTGSGANAFDVRASVFLTNLRATGWSVAGGDRKLLDLTEATAQIQEVILEGCTFDGAPDGWVVFCAPTTAVGAPTVGVARAVARGCDVRGVAWGIQLDTYGVRDVSVHGCRFADIEENAVWLGRDIATLAEFESQGDFVVTANQFHRIGDGSAQSDPDRHAIICFGKRAVIESNTIDTVDNDTGGDCEGIYVKVTEAVIAGNTLFNAGRGQGMIAQKGQERAAGSRPGYNVVIANNVLRAGQGWTNASALSIGVGEAIVANNIIDGMTDTAIVAGGSDGEVIDLLIQGNRIVNTVAAVAVSLNCPGSRSVKVLDNLIDGIDGDTGNAVGVVVSNGDSSPYEELVIRGNTFRAFAGGGTHVCGILDNITQTPSIVEYWIERNRFDDMDHGVKFTDPSPRPTRFRCYHNDFTGCAVGGIDGAAGLNTQNARFLDNANWLSENSGVAAFAGGATSVVVTHGLSWTRRLDRRVILIPGVSAPGTVPYITSAGPTTFTVNVDGGHSDQIGWEVVPHVEPFP